MLPVELEPLFEESFVAFEGDFGLEAESWVPDDVLLAADLDRVEPVFGFELDFLAPLVLPVLVRPPLAAPVALRLELVFPGALELLADDDLPDAVFEVDDFEAPDLVLSLACVLDALFDALAVVPLLEDEDDLAAVDEPALLSAWPELLRFLAVEWADDEVDVASSVVEVLSLDEVGASGTAAVAFRAAERTPDSACSAAWPAVSRALCA